MNLFAFISNLRGPDLILILLIILVLFGSKKLPELARAMGQALKEFNKAKDDSAADPQQPVPPNVTPTTPTVPLSASTPTTSSSGDAQSGRPLSTPERLTL